MKDKAEEKKDELYKNLTSYISARFENWEITEKERDEAIESLELWDFEKVILASGLIEAINNTIMLYGSIVVVWMMLKLTPENPTTAALYAYLVAKIPKVLYSYAITDYLEVENKLSFSLWNTVPFWKFIVPFVWLRKDKELSKNLVSYTQHRVNDTLSQPLSQYVMRLLH